MSSCQSSGYSSKVTEVTKNNIQCRNFFFFSPVVVFKINLGTTHVFASGIFGFKLQAINEVGAQEGSVAYL